MDRAEELDIVEITEDLLGVDWAGDASACAEAGQDMTFRMQQLFLNESE